MINFKHKGIEKGFTLIELMIVVVILAVLVAVVLPSYQDSIRKARRADVMDALTDCAAVQARNYSAESPPSYMDEDELIDDVLCNPIGGALTSKEEFYTLTVDDQAACTTGPTRWCFLLRAQAAPGSTQLSDEQCATWTLDYRGFKTSADTAGNDTTEFCWRS